MSIKKNFFRDFLYSGASKYSTIFIHLIVTSILARILSPDDFGVVAVATVFITFFNLFSDFGIAPAIIQFKDLTNKDLRSIFGWTLWIGVVLSSLFFLASPYIARFYDNTRLDSICKFLSLQIFFATLNIVPNALLLKDKKFNIVALRTVVVQTICGVFAVVAAYHGMGVYALLINPILGTFFYLLINVCYLKLPISLLPKKSSFLKIFSFSAFQFLFNLINYVGNNLDKMIIGKAFNMSSLGYYEKAYRLEQLPTHSVAGVMSPVLHPYLSDFQKDPSRILSIYNRINRMMLCVAFPISAFCLLCSREIVLIVFGSQWVESITYFSIISISVAMQLSTVHTGAILQSNNNTRLLFILGVTNVTLALAALCLGVFVFKSVVAICFCTACSSVFSAIISYIITYRYCFHSSAKQMFLYSLKPLSFYMLIVALWFVSTLLFPDSNVILSFIVKSMLWAAVTFLFLEFFTEFKPSSYLKRLKRKELF